MTTNAAKDNWLKQMGVDAGCEWCLHLEIENDRLKLEVSEGEQLAVELAQERARYRDEAKHWRVVARLALAVLVSVFVMVVAGWVR